MGLTLAMTLIFEFSRWYVILTIWWPRSGVRIYQMVTGVTSDVGVPSTHLVIFVFCHCHYYYYILLMYFIHIHPHLYHNDITSLMWLYRHLCRIVFFQPSTTTAIHVVAKPKWVNILWRCIWAKLKPTHILQCFKSPLMCSAWGWLETSETVCESQLPSVLWCTGMYS